MIEIIIIVLLVAYIAYKEYITGKERVELINRILAKDINELRDLKMAENVKVNVETPSNNLAPMDEVSDEEFMLGIKQDIGEDDKGIKNLKEIVRKKVK